MFSARKSLAGFAALVLTAPALGALLQQKVVEGVPSRVSKNLLTLITNVSDGTFMDFEVGKDVPVLIDGYPAELAELETCGKAKLEIDGKTVKKITAEFIQFTDLRGTIKAIDLDKGTLTIYAFWDGVAKDVTLKFTDETKVYFKGKPTKLSEIKPRVTIGTIRPKLRETVVILRAEPMQ